MLSSTYQSTDHPLLSTLYKPLSKHLISVLGHREARRHGYASAPALDAGSGNEPGKQLAPLQREQGMYALVGCEVHWVKASI